jgi:regulator of sigma E protease
MNVVLLILGIALFLSLVVVHEWGHFIVARLNGVEVQEFGIGLPPRIIGWRTRGGWIFSLNWLPIGGFVKLKGEHDTDTESGSLGAANVGAKTQIMVAGVAMNLLSAYIILVGLAFVGMPQLISDQFIIKNDAIYVSRAEKYIAASTVEKGSPAALAGIKTDDEILAFGVVGNAMKVTGETALPNLTKQYAGQNVQVEYRHGKTGQTIIKKVLLRSVSEVAQAKVVGRSEGYLGVSVYPAQSGVTLIRSTWSAPIVAAGVIKQYTVLTIQGLWKAIEGVGGIVAGFVTHNTAARQAAQNQAASQVSGPVGIFFIFKYASLLGLRFVLFIVAILSLTLAIMNILPIPALDGGRLWLMLFTHAIKRPLSPDREEAINIAGFAFLMVIIIVISIIDVRRFF